MTPLFLLVVRLGALLLLAPPFSSAQIPAPIRLGLVLSLVAVFAFALPPQALTAAMDMGQIWRAAFAEFGIGAAMALGVHLAFAAFAAAGGLLDVQIGFGIGQVLDPQSQRSLSLVSGALARLAPVLFILTGAHHDLLRGFALSLDKIPLGSDWSLDRPLRQLMHQSTASFALGFALVAPIVSCLLLLEIGIGVLARNLPQMNAFAIGLPLKVLVGLGALCAWAPGSVSAMTRIYGLIFSGWKVLFF